MVWKWYRLIVHGESRAKRIYVARIPGRGDSPKVGEFRGAENSPKVGTVGSLLPMTGRKSGYQKKIIPLQTQTIIMKPIFIVYCFAIAIFTSAEVYSQHNHGTKDTTKANKPFDITGVFSTFMSDPELAKYKMESSVITVAPKFADTVSHTHDGELFGYVMEGSVEIGLNHQPPVLFKTGQMFYEKRNIIHSFLRNPDEHTTTRILLITIIKEGRNGYTPLYSRK